MRSTLRITSSDRLSRAISVEKPFVEVPALARVDFLELDERESEVSDLGGAQSDLFGLLHVGFALQVTTNIGKSLPEASSNTSGLSGHIASCGCCIPFTLENNLMSSDFIIDAEEVVVGQIGVIINTTIVLDELLLAHALGDLDAVQISIE
ncbi:hypothetical protein HG531_000529 [Fusarium graminearum]|nr:hypothetical protein HG531_000529 [Fusarium graminearum]